MVSIILTTYNRAEFLRDALQTLSEQDYPGTTQLLLCDDGSTDRTLEIAEEYRRDFDDFQIISEFPTDQQRKTEVRYARMINKALPFAKEKYITYSTDDDLYHPHRFRTMVEYLETHPDIFLVYHYMRVFRVNRQKIFTELIWDLCHPWTPGLRYWIENIWNYIDHSSFMHRNLFLKNILWNDDPKYMRCGDWGFIKSALSDAPGGFAHIPEYLAIGRKIEGMSVHFDGVERYLESSRSASLLRREAEDVANEVRSH